MRWLLLLLPSLAFAQVPNYRPGQSPAVTCTLASGNCFNLKQGADICLNSTTCSQEISADADGIILRVPTGDDFSLKVNGTDALVVGATTAVFTGGLTTSATGGVTLGASGPTLTYDATDLILNVPSGKGFNFKVNGTNKFYVSSGGAGEFVGNLVAGPVTLNSSTGAVSTSGTISSSHATSGVQVPTGSKVCLDGSTCQNYVYLNSGDGKVYIGVANGDRLAVTGGGTIVAGGIGIFGAGLKPSGDNNLVWKTGTGSPESAVTGLVGSMFLRTDGDDDTNLYLKTSGTGNTGWVSVAPSLVGTAVIDFPNNAGTFDCDTSAITVTGAALGYACALGISADMSAQEGTFSCEVTGTDAVVAKHCGTGDPGSATYTARVFKN